MEQLRVSLLGKLRVTAGGQDLVGSNSHKAWELFCYLLLNRQRPHPREALATLQWSDRPTAQAKKYLRQALWQLQAAINPQSDSGVPPVLLLDAEWIRVNPSAGLWLDVDAFEEASDSAKGVSGHRLNESQAAGLKAAVELYQGDLLEGCYQDWCLYERERFRSIYLTMLDKLLAYCEARHDYSVGLAYADLALRCDRARERTHRRLMRLYYLSGNRTEALRQYERCATALEEELGVEPDRPTVALYEQIRTGGPRGLSRSDPTANGSGQFVERSVPEILARLTRLQVELSRAQEEVRQDILALEQVMQRSGCIDAATDAR
jgi:DNA-binding SARP family transcriptional activator